MEFRCEVVDTVPCQAWCFCWHVPIVCVCVCVKHDPHASGHASKVRNWHNLMPNVATLKNAYRDRPTKRRAQHDISEDEDEEISENPLKKKVPQSFTFMRREGWPLLCLSQSIILFATYATVPLSCAWTFHFWFVALSAMPGNIELDDHVPRRLRQEGCAKDVFAMVKMNMSDSVLSQNPLNVWPEAFVSKSETFWNSVNTTSHIVQQSLDSERESELKKLYMAISKDFPHLYRSVNYYKTLLDSSRPRKPYANLDFVDAGPNAGERIPNVQLGERAAPPLPHPLQVVFHRWPALQTWGASWGQTGIFEKRWEKQNKWNCCSCMHYPQLNFTIPWFWTQSPSSILSYIARAFPSQVDVFSLVATLPWLIGTGTTTPFWPKSVRTLTMCRT